MTTNIRFLAVNRVADTKTDDTCPECAAEHPRSGKEKQL